MLISGPFGPREDAGIWVFPLDSAAPRKLIEDANSAVLSPDESRIAYLRGGALWVVDASGRNARRIVSPAQEYALEEGMAWSPDGRRVAYGKRSPDQFSVESYDLATGGSHVIFSDRRVGGFCWARDGRIIYARQEEAPNETTANLWDVRVDFKTARTRGKPRRLTNWGGYIFDVLSSGAGGARLAFTRKRFRSSVYVGDIEPGRERVDAPRRLTFDDWINWPTGWSRDSRSVLFTSDRGGRLDILRQEVDSPVPLAIVHGEEERHDARFSSDGRWILYLTPPEKNGQTAEGRLMRVAPGGGTPRQVLLVAGYPPPLRAAATGTAPGAHVSNYPRFRCAAAPRSLCVLSETIRNEVIFTAFDPVAGRRGELARVGAPRPDSWDLSPDGQWIAFVPAWSNTIQLLSLAGQPPRKVSAPGWRNLQSLAWAADGKALFATPWASQNPPILRISLNGQVTVTHVGLLHVTNPIPSPDGRSLAFGENTMESNVWVVRNLH